MEKCITGYPSIDKPWQSFYSTGAITAELPENSIYEYLFDCNQKNLNEPAIIYFDRTVKYCDLFELIDKVAKSFISVGVKQNDIVSILSLSTPETIACIYALNKIGAVISMEPITQTNKLLSHSLLETSTEVIVVLDIFFQKYAETFAKLPIKKVIVLDTVAGQNDYSDLQGEKYLPFASFCMLPETETCIELPRSRGDDPAVIVQTSGTTAIPKKVILTNKNINSVPFNIILPILTL